VLVPDDACLSGERGLPFVSSFDANVIVAPAHVKLSKETSLSKAVDDIGGQREGISIFDRKVV